jgi:hypothetical protein
MAEGIIQQNMGRPEGEELTLENVKKNIKVPPELQEAYERVVIGGMKVMFSKESHQFMLKEMQGQGPVAQRLGQGIAGLMLLLFKESNETIPPEVIIPAGIELLMQAVDFVRETGMGEITNKDIGDAMEIMMRMILEKFGMKPEQFEQVFNQFDNTNVDAAAQQMGAPNA